MNEPVIDRPIDKRSKLNFWAMNILFTLSALVTVATVFFVYQYIQFESSLDQAAGLGIILFGFLIPISCILLSPLLIIAFALLINIKPFDTTKASSSEYTAHYYKKAVSFGLAGLILSLCLTLLIFYVQSLGSLLLIPIFVTIPHILIWSFIYLSRAATSKKVSAQIIQSPEEPQL